jgi:hypothetical protein
MNSHEKRWLDKNGEYISYLIDTNLKNDVPEDAWTRTLNKIPSWRIFDALDKSLQIKVRTSKAVYTWMLSFHKRPKKNAK